MGFDNMRGLSLEKEVYSAFHVKSDKTLMSSVL